MQWKSKTEPPTHATSNLGKGVEFKNGFVLAEKSKNRKNNLLTPQPACSAGTLVDILRETPRNKTTFLKPKIKREKTIYT